jgi:hypothetical protein
MTGKPVELLRDGRGIYGVGVADEFDIEALAWTCGIDNPTPSPSHPRDLIFRPDLLRDNQRHYSGFAVMQKITGGFRHGMFAHSCEEHLRQYVHHEALNRAGLPWPPAQENGIKYWSRNKKRQDRNRQIYHGLRLGSLHIINKLIGQAIEEAADPLALATARRFTFRYRESIYGAAARSRRALQLAETFPVLARVIYCDDMSRERERESMRRGSWARDYEARTKERMARVQEATALVERGVRLRDVAAVMQVPMSMRHIKPGAANIVDEIHKSEWIRSYMPDSLPRMRLWLRAVRYARDIAGPDFAEWAAKNVLQIPVGGVATFLENTADWVRACRDPRSDLSWERNNGHRFVVRPFSPDMSLRTVTKLSADWHEAVAASNGSHCAFPPPWIPPATINGLDIIPIDNSNDLYLEGAAMHHCVGIYSLGVVEGEHYIYGIRRDGERVATAALTRRDGRAVLQQIRGPCNVEPPAEIKTTVRRWLRFAGNFARRAP